MSAPSSLTGLTFNVTSGNPSTLVGSQQIPVSSLTSGNNSIPITDSNILAVLNSGNNVNHHLTCSHGGGVSVFDVAGTPYVPPLLLPVPNFFKNPPWVNTFQDVKHLELNGWSLSSNVNPPSDEPLRSILFDYSDLANNSSFIAAGATKPRTASFPISSPVLIRIVSPVQGKLTRVDLYGGEHFLQQAKNVEIWCASSDHGMTPDLTTQATKVGDLVITRNYNRSQFNTLNITPPRSGVKVLYIKFLNNWGGWPNVTTGGIRPYIYV